MIKVALSVANPVTIVFDRLWLGAAVVAACVLIAKIPVGLNFSVAARAGGLGLLGNVAPFLLVAWAEIHVTSVAAVVLQATIPLFTYGFAVKLAGERFSTLEASALLVGLGGVVILNNPHSFEQLFSRTWAGLAGELALLGASACFGLAVVLNSRLLKGTNAISVAGMQLGLSAVVLGGWKATIGGGIGFTSGWQPLGALLILGLLGTGIAYMLYFWLIQRVGSTLSSLVTYLVPVVGIPLGSLTLGEPVGLGVGFGVATILAGALGVGLLRSTRGVAVPEPGGGVVG